MCWNQLMAHEDIRVICFHLRQSHAPNLIPHDTMVYIIGFILLSGYCTNNFISSNEGALSSATVLGCGRPLVIFFQGIGMSHISQ